jgi:ribosomal protein S27AE
MRYTWSMGRPKLPPRFCPNCGDLMSQNSAKGYCGKCYKRFRKHGDPNAVRSRWDGYEHPACSECGESAVAHGYCVKHYQRWKKHGDPAIVLTTAERDCSHCGDPVGRHGAYGYCGRCYARWRRHGDPSTGYPRGPQGGYRKYSLNDEYFDQIDTPAKAYWLGFIAADGCVLEDPAGRPSYLRVELARCDDDHLGALCADLGSDRPVLYYQDVACVSFGSRHMANALCRLGVMPRKSLIIEPWNGPADLMPHYWRGLFDGDGTIHTSKSSWCIGICGSYACVAAFGSWARGITGARAQPRSVRKDCECWQWSSQGSEKSQLLAAALYEDAPVALERKLVLAQELCAIDFKQLEAQRNIRRSAAVRDAWATGRHPRAKKT